MFPWSSPAAGLTWTCCLKEDQMDQFKLVSEFKPSGDQPQAIAGLVNGVNWGLR